MGLLGIGIGLFASFIAFIYFIPFWSYVDITPNGFILSEITAVKYGGWPGKFFEQDQLILKTTSGEYLLFSEEKWLAIDLENFDHSNFNTQPSSCGEWTFRPPPTYLRKIVDSHGIESEGPLRTDLRCYILLENGRIQVWMRHINVFLLFYVVGGGAFVGFGLGVIMFVKYRRFKLSRTL